MTTFCFRAPRLYRELARCLQISTITMQSRSSGYVPNYVRVSDTIVKVLPDIRHHKNYDVSLASLSINSKRGLFNGVVNIDDVPQSVMSGVQPSYQEIGLLMACASVYAAHIKYKETTAVKSQSIT